MSSANVKGQVKGLLKGLRYISQMFDEQGDDKDIQIGFPTDVKHLAHIGCDDSQTHKPSWMTEFKGPQNKGQEEPSSGSAKLPEDNNGKVDGSRHHNRRSKHSSTESNSPNREPNVEGSVSKHRRSHRSSDPSESSRRPRRHSNNNESGTEDEKPPSTTKPSHRRKSKTSEDKEGSVRRTSRTIRKGSKESSLTDSEIS
ncbi:hypothetical protein RIF29_21555 [Crotalaria pallida]|uniref:CRIB domain-containing protein n=1 Tax=Crotalaria pallida TaxID=3830 RepID=A0AAN9F6V5_CROPI